MTHANVISSSVDVPVDPDTAFRVFTEELDCWWIQGPINFFDASRAYSKRMEQGVGGRIIEVYDIDSGEGLELGRITIWEPGLQLAWASSIDEVTISVKFEAEGESTLVTVVATINEGGRDKGGTAWVRMTPVWFADWISKRGLEPRQPKKMSRLAIAVYYADPPVAAAWLRDVFDLEPAGVIPTELQSVDQTWIEFHVGNSSLILFRTEDAANPIVSHTPWVFVDDLDSHFAKSQRCGAKIIDEIWEHGARAYSAADPEGHQWTFAQASPRM